MPRTRNRALALAMTGLLGFGASGCYGSFALTRWVYDFNGKVTEHKFVHSITTWAFLILPVYSIAGFVDFVVLNMIEFWTEKPVIDLPQAPRVHLSSDNAVDIEMGGAVLRMEPATDGSWTVAREGIVVGSVLPDADGGLLVRDAAGRVLTTFDAADLLAAEGRIAQLAAAEGR